jgi:DEAD/DEAH box helicase domain-containing protein
MTGVIRGICDDDISGLSIDRHEAFAGSAGIFVHENTAGGAGLIKRLSEPANFRQVLRAALEQVEKCRCADGCPSCVLDRLCGNDNSYLDKDGSRLLLFALVAAAE